MQRIIAEMYSALKSGRAEREDIASAEKLIEASRIMWKLFAGCDVERPVTRGTIALLYAFLSPALSTRARAEIEIATFLNFLQSELREAKSGAPAPVDILGKWNQTVGKAKTGQ